MSFVLSLDQGTTSSRAIVFAEDGTVAGMAQQEFRQIFPQPGWVEHDASEIWESQLAVARGALVQAGVDARDVAGIGITNQRETVVVWDRLSGEPVANAIVWQDRRTADDCARMKRDGLEPLFRERTGLLLDPYFSGTKLKWLLDAVEAAGTHARNGGLAFGTIDAWLLWNLTGGRVHATDASNASRTLLFDIHQMDWSDELLDVLGVPRELLPEVVDSSGIIGETDADVLGSAIPIAGVAGDQQAALFGQVCLEPGQTKNTYGTGCFMLRNTGSQPVASENNLLTTVAWRKDGDVTYALEGSVFIAGAVIQWLRDGLRLIESSADVEKLAATVDDTGGVYLVPAFAGLGAPYWDPFARGTITGITRGTSAGHLARAALEGIAFQTADVLEAMNADVGERLVDMRVDGGASQNNLLMQVQADLLGVPVVRPTATETTARGAAFLAGLATGVWTMADLKALWTVDRRFEPDLSRDDVGHRKQTWRRAVERARAWIERAD